MILRFNIHKDCTLTDIVDIERAKKGKTYSGDCIIIQVSATKGQCFYIPHPQQIQSHYVVLTRKPNVLINMYYLFLILQENLPEFLAVYQTGLNIQPSIFDFMKIKLHSDITTQNFIADLMRLFDELIALEERLFIDYTDFKKWHTWALFVDEEPASIIGETDDIIDPNIREMKEELLLVKKKGQSLTEKLHVMGIDVEGMPYPFKKIIWENIVRGEL